MKSEGESKGKIEVTCEQLGELLVGFTLPTSGEDPLEFFDVSNTSERGKTRLKDEIFILNMFAITYACQQKITNPKVSQRILDFYHEHLYDWLKYNGAPDGEIVSFSERVQEHYKGYGEALRKELEDLEVARKAGKKGFPFWGIGKMAVEYAFGDFKGYLLNSYMFIVSFGIKVKATRDLIGKYKILVNKENEEG